MRRTLGREALNPPYSSFVSSDRPGNRDARYSPTGRAPHRGADHREPGLRSAVEDRWREASTAAGKDASVADMRIFDVDLVAQDSQLLDSALRRVFDMLPDGGRALVVGQSPTNEAAVLGLTGQVIGPMGKGEGVLIVDDAGRYTVGSP